MTVRSPSLTRRLIISLTVGFAAVWAVAGVATLWVLNSELDASYDRALQETAQRLLPLALDGLDDRDGDHDQPHDIPRLGGDGDENVFYHVRDHTGRVLLRSDDTPERGFDAPLQPGFVSSDGLRIYTGAAVDGQSFIQVGEELAHRQESLAKSILTLFLPLLAIIPLAALGIWLVVRRGIRPVVALQHQIGERSGTDLSPVATAGLPAELVPIADAVNHLLLRLGTVLEAERGFAANSAHELRTPIAGALAQVQRLLAELPDGEGRQRGTQIEATLKRLRDLAEKLLQLARADAGIAATGAAVDLTQVIELVADDARRRMPGTGRLRLMMAEPLVAAIDADAFAIALRNLIDNATAHGDADAPVTVEVNAGGVRVISHGPVVPAAELERLKTRFARGGSRAPGAGLGLSIVETIATQAGGTLELFSPARGAVDGFEAWLRFGPAPQSA